MHKRMSGKGGRFRKTALGKRVDGSARSTVDPAPPDFDPHELGVPEAVATVLVVPERVTSRNLEAMRRCVEIGNKAVGGAAMVFEPPDNANGQQRTLGKMMEGYTKDRGKPISLKMMTEDERRRFAASELAVGYTVLRHVQEGDAVMFNRQPTLHKGSWMAFRAGLTEAQLPAPRRGDLLQRRL